MPLPLAAALIPAAMSLGTGILGHIGKKEQAKQAAKMAAIQAKYSPWTKVPDLQRAENPALMPDILAGVGGAMASMAQKQGQDGPNVWERLFSSSKMAKPTMEKPDAYFKGGYDDPGLYGIEDVRGDGEYSLGEGMQKAYAKKVADALLGKGRGGRIPV